MLFNMGKTYATKGVIDKSSDDREFEKHVSHCIMRHAVCDWGDLNEEDERLNNEAIKDGLRVLSAYESDKHGKLWVITEADRSATTVLFPSEF